MSRMSAQLRVPLGTRVVVHGTAADAAVPGTGRGLAGRVVRDSGEVYTVALADGQLVEAPGDQLTASDDLPADLPEPVRAGEPDELVAGRTLYAAAVEWPPAEPGDELTIRGVHQVPTAALWSLEKPPEQVAGPGADWLSWEVEQFCRLALAADPESHEMLWSARPVWVGDAGRQLLDLRPAFLSQAISASYADHVLAGFKQLDEDGTEGDERWAGATRLLRLLAGGIALLRTGDAGGPAGEHDERLAAVRAGELPWEQVDAYRLELHQQLDETAEATFLPAEPDTGRVQAWLSDLRRRDLG